MIIGNNFDLLNEPEEQVVEFFGLFWGLCLDQADMGLQIFHEIETWALVTATTDWRVFDLRGEGVDLAVGFLALVLDLLHQLVHGVQLLSEGLDLVLDCDPDVLLTVFGELFYDEILDWLLDQLNRI